MALKIDTVFKEIPVTQAYLRVVLPSIRRGNEFIEFVLEYTAKEDATHFLVQHFECPYDLVGDNPIAQAYEYLKTLPEFEGCTDC